MKRLLLVLFLLALPVSAGLPGVQTLPGGEAGVTVGDPCVSTGIVKSSVPVNVVTVATTQLVALSGTQTIYVCGFQLSLTGATTNTTAQFEYGTGAACGTGTTVLTGAMGGNSATSAVVVDMPPASTQLKTPAGNALCLVSAGTTVSIQGFVTYVQM